MPPYDTIRSLADTKIPPEAIRTGTYSPNPDPHGSDQLTASPTTTPSWPPTNAVKRQAGCRLDDGGVGPMATVC